MKIQRLPLSRQLALAVLLICVLVFSALVVALSVISNRAALAQTESHLSQQMTSIAAAIDEGLAGAEESARVRLDIYRKMLGGELALAEQTLPSGSLPAVRVMKAGGVVLNDNLDLLLRVRDAIGADPAVMVLHENRFIRVATLLKDKEGKSQVGVPLPQDGPETRLLSQGKPYFGVVQRSGKFYMSIFEPVFGAGQRVVGAVSIRTGLDSLVGRLDESMKQMKIGATGYAFVFAPAANFGESRMLSHPTLAGKSVAEIDSPLVEGVVRRMAEIKSGVFRYDWTDSRTGISGNKIAAVATVKSTGWIVGAGSWVDEFTSEMRHLRNLMMLALLASALLIIGVVTWIARSRLQAVNRMVDAVTRMGEGDLRNTFAPASPGSRCETDRLNDSLQVMQTGMAEMIGKINQSARQMTAATQALTEASNRVATASHSQSDSSSSLAAAVEQLSVSISHVSAGAADAQKLSQQAASAAQRGSQQVSAVVGDMQSIDGEMHDAASLVRQLGERTAQISTVVGVIKEIADQTNLLALNAAIEAARAGESGRGFAVVADEVRKLAERTTGSTAEISGSIGGVQRESQEVVRRIEQVAGRVAAGVQAAQGAGDVLRRIELQSQEAVGAVSGIAHSTREQSTASQEIANGVESISRMAEGNAQAAQDNRSNAQDLRQMAQELEQMVARFRL